MEPPQGHGPPPMPAQQHHAPQKKNRLGWILGGAGAATALIVVLLFAGCAALADAVKNGGSNEEKAQAMIAKADNLPQNDWQLVERSDPDTGCLATDTACVRLNATWSVNHKVGLEDTAGRLGVDISGPPMGRYTGCLKSEMEDGGIVRVCIDPAPALDDNWLVSIELTTE
ncbi:hypothetical protein [Arthrobacter oryzae]|uniref:hypothetical protein n=1 Tax=Arthrobacter oryzae TaxID=409290 RepID=UPI00278B1F5B|nr:hypothetical protein [Arthrobacter oryzae]MDQ0076878.1 hypothetical protein [Arthrobacter oryzae]